MSAKLTTMLEAYYAPADLPDRWVYLITFGSLFLLWSASSFLAPQPNAPLLNPKKWFELSKKRAIDEVLFNMQETLDTWFAQNPKKSIRLLSDIGEMTVVSPHLADSFKSDPNMSFVRANNPPFHPQIPGFEPFREGGKDEAKLIRTVLNKDLNKLLNKITWPLAQEAQLATPEYFGAEVGWHAIRLKDTILPLVARLSTRVFMGEDLCRNEDWLKIAANYSSDSFMAADHLRKWPKPLRLLVSYFASDCRGLRDQISSARKTINPILQKRRALKEEALTRGEKLEFEDSLEWFERNAHSSGDPVAMQLFLSLVAIHTTTDLISQFMTDITYHPEILAPLKEEILTTLKQEGWTKSALFKMKLLDSAVKESQRLKPIQIATMLRSSPENYTLPDGTFIPKDHIVSVSTHAMRDAAVHKDPLTWDGYRFFRQRDQPGKELTAQLATTTLDHMGFGHGLHACPGRFFAANEIKIAMIFIILQYEWRLPSGAAKPRNMSWGVTWTADPTTVVEVRRVASIDIDVEGGVSFG